MDELELEFSYVMLFPANNPYLVIVPIEPVETSVVVISGGNRVCCVLFLVSLSLLGVSKFVVPVIIPLHCIALHYTLFCTMVNGPTRVRNFV